MINYWWVTRPKRKLNSVPEVLSTFAELSLNQQWEGQRASHLSLEDALEQAGLKRQGERRDQRGGGARTYKAWLVSLGLIFIQESTGQIKLTLAGEAIINGASPVEVLKGQVLKYQFPSAFSVGRSVKVAPRFKIHPFLFLLKLLMDSRVGSLSQDEIAHIVIVEAENESERCYEKVVQRILAYRNDGAAVLTADFNDIYGVSSNSTNLKDVANTMMNWLEYTQLTLREGGRIYVVSERKAEVAKILEKPLPFIDRPNEHEFFQRKYGIDPKHNKDTRNLSDSKTITAKMLAEQQVMKAYIALSLQKPITKINASVIEHIVSVTGLGEPFVVETLHKKYPKGSVGTFMTKYYEMAFKGRDEATEFEKATVELFRDVFGYQASHIGAIGLTPDVLVLSDSEGYAGIIDNKAYSNYTISNDHHNRMVHNYIGGFGKYYKGTLPLGFFTYIAGGFGQKIDSQVKGIAEEAGVHGSVINVHNMIELVQAYEPKHYTHADLRKLFTLDRQILTTDFV